MESRFTPNPEKAVADFKNGQGMFHASPIENVATVDVSIARFHLNIPCVIQLHASSCLMGFIEQFAKLIEEIL